MAQEAMRSLRQQQSWCKGRCSDVSRGNDGVLEVVMAEIRQGRPETRTSSQRQSTTTATKRRRDNRAAEMVVAGKMSRVRRSSLKDDVGRDLLQMTMGRMGCRSSIGRDHEIGNPGTCAYGSLRPQQNRLFGCTAARSFFLQCTLQPN
jgi:hypothetical protein